MVKLRIIKTLHRKLMHTKQRNLFCMYFSYNIQSAYQTLYCYFTGKSKCRERFCKEILCKEIVFLQSTKWAIYIGCKHQIKNYVINNIGNENKGRTFLDLEKVERQRI